jgi:hypothetical protein
VKGEAAELARELNLRIGSLYRDLLPNAERRGMWARVGSLAGENGQSLAIILSGPRRGRWHDYASDERGDALDLVAQVECNGDILKAMDWARQWLGRPERERDRKPPPSPAPASGRAIALGVLEQNGKRAMALWLACNPVERGDVVWRYLADRGIDLGRLPRVPSVLRCHPGLWNGESQRAWPAMVALITDADGKNCAVHRTWLEERNLAFEDGPRVGKAPLKDPKLSLGPFRGGYIRLWRGAKGRPWSSIEPGETLLIAEGIEDLLSYVQFEPQWRAACAVSLSFMMAMELPPEFTEIRILAQRDPRMTADGKTVRLSPARRLLTKVIARFEAEGRKVYYWAPPVFVKDVNEYIQHLAVIGGGVSDARRAG